MASSSGSSLLRRLATSYALLVALIVVAGMSGAIALAVSLSATDRLLHAVAPTRRANADVSLVLTEMQSGVRGYLLDGDTRFLVAVRADRSRWDAERERMTAVAATSSHTNRVRRELRLADAWVRRYVDPVLDRSDQPDGLAAVRATRDPDLARGAFDDFRSAAGDLERRLDRDESRLEQRSSSVRVAALVVLLVVVAGSVVLGSLAAWTTARAAVVPLSRLRRTVQSITAGDGDQHADESSGPAEVRAVAGAVNALTDERARARSAAAAGANARRLAHDVGLRIRERLDAPGIEQTAVEELGHAFGVDRVLLRRLDSGVLAGTTTQWHELDLDPLGAGRLGRLHAAGTALQAEALWGDVAVLTGTVGTEHELPEDGEAAEVLRATAAQSCLVVAFGAGRETLGTLTLLHERTRHRWSYAQLAAVEAIAADLGRALQHALLYERERTLVSQLRELDRTKTDFLSTVSHELRTPLTSITGYIELLRDEVVGLEPSAVRMLDVIERNSYRLNALIEDLLVLSRIESGAVQVQRVPIDVPSLVHNACADVEPAADDAGLTLTVLHGEPVVRVTGDPGQLDRVLLNLLSNAVKFTPTGGRVSVGWAVERPAGASPHVVITVADTGIGIPDEERGRLASRFFRASNAMDAAIPGTGLGLTIVRGILDLHGGSLSISSSSVGTEVSVRLPLAAATAPADAGTTVAALRL
jgi:signal transduction histidine kinase/CHASE3 domain sensor protein